MECLTNTEICMTLNTLTKKWRSSQRWMFILKLKKLSLTSKNILKLSLYWESIITSTLMVLWWFQVILANLILSKDKGSKRHSISSSTDGTLSTKLIHIIWNNSPFVWLLTHTITQKAALSTVILTLSSNRTTQTITLYTQMMHRLIKQVKKLLTTSNWKTFHNQDWISPSIRPKKAWWKIFTLPFIKDAKTRKS